LGGGEGGGWAGCNSTYLSGKKKEEVAEIESFLLIGGKKGLFASLITSD